MFAAVVHRSGSRRVSMFLTGLFWWFGQRELARKRTPPSGQVASRLGTPGAGLYPLEAAVMVMARRSERSSDESLQNRPSSRCGARCNASIFLTVPPRIRREPMSAQSRPACFPVLARILHAAAFRFSVGMLAGAAHAAGRIGHGF